MWSSSKVFTASLHTGQRASTIKTHKATGWKGRWNAERNQREYDNKQGSLKYAPFWSSESKLTLVTLLFLNNILCLHRQRFAQQRCQQARSPAAAEGHEDQVQEAP